MKEQKHRLYTKRNEPNTSLEQHHVTHIGKISDMNIQVAYGDRRSSPSCSERHEQYNVEEIKSTDNTKPSEIAMN